jgi:drug/metabolite transporter (DMT)-like permease
MAAGSEFAAVVFGLAASAVWGTSDFSGGLAARRAPVFAVMTGAYGVGLVLLVALALARAEPVASPYDLAWGTTAGLVGAAGLTAFYRALAVGRMGLAAPVASVLGAALPVLFGALHEGLPGTVQMAGFGFAITSLWLISRSQMAAGGSDGLGLAVLAGLGFGGFFILIDRVQTGAVFWPLIAARGASLVLMIGFAVTSRRRWQPTRDALAFMTLAGLLDVGGNTFFLLAAQAGRLDVSTVLSSLYPGVTVLLARAILKEQVTRTQGAGIALALIAIPLIAA